MHCFTAQPHKSCTTWLTKSTNHALLHCPAKLILHCSTKTPTTHALVAGAHIPSLAPTTMHLSLPNNTNHTLLNCVNKYHAHIKYLSTQIN